MKIALISNHFRQYKGGAEYQSLLYANELKKSGHDIFFLSCAKDGKNTREEIEGDRVYHCSPGWIRHIPILKNGDIYYFALFRMRYILRTEKPDVILEIGDFSVNGIMVFLGKYMKIPMAWVCASDSSLYPIKFNCRAPLSFPGRKIMAYGIRNAQAHFLQNEEQIAAFRTHFPGIEYGIFPNVQMIPEDVPPKAKPFLVVWVANLKPMKRPERFIDLAESFRSRSDIHFIMIGRDHYSNIREVRNRIGILPNIEFLGELPQAEVNDWLGKASLLVNTSTYEGFSNTFVQAWMRKTPVFTLNVNPSKIFDSQKIGACADDDMQRLHDLVEDFLDHPEKLESYSRQAFEYAQKNHCVEQVFPRMLDCIQQLASNKNSL